MLISGQHSLRNLALASYIMMMASAFIRNRHLTQFRRSTVNSSLDDIMNEVLNIGNFSLFEPSMNKELTVGSYEESWIAVDWSKEERHVVASPPSPVDQVWIRDRPVYIKRDDQLRLPGSQLSGNKARKMLTLACMQDFPECIVSYGGPQSNAMLALAAVVHFQNEKRFAGKKKRFVYYTKTLPRFLRSQPNGNLFRALSLGMELVQVSAQDYNDLFGGDFGGSPEPPKNLPPPVPGKSIWIPQGGACGVAVAGARLLAEEIVSYWGIHGNGRPLTVAVPGGTCSTAVLLHNAIRSIQKEQSAENKLDIKVLVVPCVGDDGYARRQMTSLLSHIQQTGTVDDNSSDLPDILAPYPEELSEFGQSRSEQYVTFGSPDSTVLEVYREIKDDCDLQLDLLYGAPAWTVLLRHWRARSLWQSSEHPTSSKFQGRQLMYVHSGGLEGISSQVSRHVDASKKNARKR